MSATDPVPATPLTVESMIAALEARAKAKESKVVTAIKTHWPHFLTWIGLAVPYVLKHL